MSATQRLGARALEPVELSRLIAIVLKVCDAVGLAHARGVIHGTLDPSSVVIGGDGAVAVQSPGTQLRLVSAAYFSTEQAWGRRADIDARTDVQGIGGMLFTILTQRAPHEQASFDLELASARCGVVKPPQELCPDRPLPAALRRIASRALSASPTDRYPSIALLKQDIERCVASARYSAGVAAAGAAILGDDQSTAGRCAMPTTAETRIAASSSYGKL